MPISSLKQYVLRYIMVLFIALAGSLVLDITPAYAQEVETLYSDDIGNCEAPGLENLFSGFVCTYQEIVDQILTTMYRGMLTFFTPPFIAALTLFLITGGAVFALGMLPFTTRDIMLILAKIALLSGFALYPELMIDLLYRGVIGFMRQTTDTVVGAIAPQGSVAGIFQWMDRQFFDFISLQDTAQTNRDCDNDVLALMFGLAVTMPPVFAIGLYILVQLVMVLVKTVLGYLLAMTGIMFLTTLAPLFLGFGLFKATKSYFEKWLSLLIGFAVQIFIVFAFIAAVLSFPFESKLSGVLDTIQPYDRIAYQDGQRLDFNNWCTLCASAALGSATQGDICTGEPITPTNMQVGGVGEFIEWIGQELLILGVLAYVMTQLLSFVPEIARIIASTPHSPTFMGQLPMEDRLTAAGNSAFRTFRDSGNALTGAGNAVRNSISSLVSGR